MAWLHRLIRPLALAEFHRHLRDMGRPVKPQDREQYPGIKYDANYKLARRCGCQSFCVYGRAIRTKRE
jgi:hypothetical protein